ncbi:hypothetical protein [Homoserinibacter sp. GY 40078]|uniref:hypothetical protein n=1 Tax=Homoserinibacter sp. GY 40078 TaxID=2603275 RepID=UPI0011C8F742|nr:hypothetical protein [Homoserinibacter sp. GY 40078]TXK17277.1 hypothetical protein FVQ89_10515 [Homoserinibacter sp. GY 40078]
MPRITRYTRPVVVADPSSLVISTKHRAFLTIPASSIVSIDSGIEALRPKGVIGPRKFPAVRVSVRRGDETATIALPPITGMYDKVRQADAAALAAELAGLLGVPVE